MPRSVRKLTRYLATSVTFGIVTTKRRLVSRLEHDEIQRRPSARREAAAAIEGEDDGGDAPGLGASGRIADEARHRERGPLARVAHGHQLERSRRLNRVDSGRRGRARDCPLPPRRRRSPPSRRRPRPSRAGAPAPMRPAPSRTSRRPARLRRRAECPRRWRRSVPRRARPTAGDPPARASSRPAQSRPPRRTRRASESGAADPWLPQCELDGDLDDHVHRGTTAAGRVEPPLADGGDRALIEAAPEALQHRHLADATRRVARRSRARRRPASRAAAPRRCSRP